ncbi:MAG: exodeoxyribonuclease VII large subunit [Anaerorhabdus sp.]
MISKNVSVTYLVKYLKRHLESDNYIQNISVCGEVGNLTKHSSGHWYFTIKDSSSQIKCVMFSSRVAKNNIEINIGDKIVVSGNISIFEGSGQIQLYVNELSIDGTGDLYKQFEILKNKLYKEGLFDESHKKQIPAFPFKIGLVVGKNSAAKADVISTLSRRWPVAKVTEFNTLVQGEKASKQIIEALMELDQMELDLILLVRGGGSIEDLNSFNDEALARSIYAIETPIITGVGHETDITIVDFVADLRSATPTAAAEEATPDINEIRNNFIIYKKQLLKLTMNKFIEKQAELNYLQNNTFFRNPRQLYQQKILSVDNKIFRIKKFINIISMNRNDLDKKIHFLTNYMTRYINTLSEDVGSKKLLINSNIKNLISRKKDLYIKKLDLLDALSPLKILKRGYSLAYNDENLITNVSNVSLNDIINIKVSDGEIKAEVKEKRKSTNE